MYNRTGRGGPTEPNPSQGEPPPSAPAPGPTPAQPQGLVGPQPLSDNPGLAKVQLIMARVLLLQEDVDEFVGKKMDKSYRCLEELLTKELLELDSVETQGQEAVRQARKEAVQRIQAILDWLEKKAFWAGLLLWSCGWMFPFFVPNLPQTLEGRDSIRFVPWNTTKSFPSPWCKMCIRMGMGPRICQEYHLESGHSELVSAVRSLWYFLCKLAVVHITWSDFSLREWLCWLSRHNLTESLLSYFFLPCLQYVSIMWDRVTGRWFVYCHIVSLSCLSLLTQNLFFFFFFSPPLHVVPLDLGLFNLILDLRPTQAFPQPCVLTAHSHCLESPPFVTHLVSKHCSHPPATVECV